MELPPIRGYRECGFRTFSRGIILRHMEPLRELSFSGRLSSMVRTPYRVLNKTSSGSSPGSSLGIGTSVDI